MFEAYTQELARMFEAYEEITHKFKIVNRRLQVELRKQDRGVPRQAQAAVAHTGHTHGLGSPFCAN